VQIDNRSENRVIFVKTARKRVVEWAAEHRCQVFIRSSTNQLYTLGVRRDHEHDCVVFVLHWNKAVMSHESEMR
jgi:hypothetical protein